MNLSVGIVTYSARFEKFFKPLVRSIKKIEPDIEVLVQVNGDYGKGLDEEYRKQMLHFCAEHKNVYPFFWTEFRSLAKLWNNCLINSSNNWVFITNDDVLINNLSVFQQIRNHLNNKNGETFKINSSWSHFVANRDEIERLHWFDERLLGVGNEDGDMQFKFECHFGRMHNLPVSGINNIISHERCLEGIQKVNKKYSKFNDAFYKNKLDMSALTEEEKKEYWVNRDKIVLKEKDPNAYPYERFYWENKNKLGEK